MLRLGTTYVMVTPTYVKFESHVFQGGDKHNYQGFPWILKKKNVLM